MCGLLWIWTFTLIYGPENLLLESRNGGYLGWWIYTKDQIEMFAEEGNTTTGSPSFKLLCDLRQRRLLFNYFIRCLEIIKCMKAFNLFIQPGEFIYFFWQFVRSITDLYLYHTHSYSSYIRTSLFTVTTVWRCVSIKV